jgi:hypothetical protein
VGETDSSELAEAPTQRLPRDLGAFATVEECQGRPAAYQGARKPATGHGHHAARPQQANVDHPLSFVLPVVLIVPPDLKVRKLHARYNIDKQESRQRALAA